MAKPETAAVRLLRDAGSIVLTTHLNPDGDGLSAVLALRHALRALGKRVRVVVPSAPPSLYAFLPGFASLRVVEDPQRAARMTPVDLLVSCDCGDHRRLGATAAIPHRRLLNIDHHASNDGFGDVAVVDLDAACTCQVVHALLRRLRVPLDRQLATCFYAGLVFDTGRFMHSNTDAAVFRFAAELLATGIDAAAINRRLTYTRSRADLQWQARAIERLEVDGRDPRIAGVAFAAADLAELGAPEDWSELVEIPRSLSGVEIAYLMRELADGVRCSLRANPPFVVADVAEAFGGGGHAQAAGCTIPLALDAARRSLLQRLRATARRR